MTDQKRHTHGPATPPRSVGRPRKNAPAVIASSPKRKPEPQPVAAIVKPPRKRRQKPEAQEVQVELVPNVIPAVYEDPLDASPAVKAAWPFPTEQDLPPLDLKEKEEDPCVSPCVDCHGCDVAKIEPEKNWFDRFWDRVIKFFA